MPELRRMLPSSNALFVFDAAARNGSFTAAAAVPPVASTSSTITVRVVASILRPDSEPSST